MLVLVENHDGLMKLKEKCNITATSVDDMKDQLAHTLKVRVPFSVELVDPDFEEWVALRDIQDLPDRIRVRISRAVRNKAPISDEHDRYIAERNKYTDRIIRSVSCTKTTAGLTFLCRVRSVRQDFEKLSNAKAKRKQNLVKSYKDRMARNREVPTSDHFEFGPDGGVKAKVITKEQREEMLKNQVCVY